MRDLSNRWLLLNILKNTKDASTNPLERLGACNVWRIFRNTLSRFLFSNVAGRGSCLFKIITINSWDGDLPLAANKWEMHRATINSLMIETYDSRGFTHLVRAKTSESLTSQILIEALLWIRSDGGHSSKALMHISLVPFLLLLLVFIFLVIK